MTSSSLPGRVLADLDAGEDAAAGGVQRVTC
jgi:hypothetical protein